MDEIENSMPGDHNSATNGIVKELNMQWSDNLAVLDLSNRKIVSFDKNMKFPTNLVELNLSHNKLSEIPSAVLNLENIKLLDISYNNISCFDDYPLFCHNIEELDLSNNLLDGPPCWVWTELPKKLVKLNVSENMKLTVSLTDDCFAELLMYKTLLKEVIIHNCRINNHLELFGTFENARSIVIGIADICTYKTNKLLSFPFPGIDKCHEVQKLALSNTEIYSIESNIDIFKNLVEIDLSQNKLRGLPNKFCDLENLEVCVLSANNILYLPDEMVKLKKLVCLRLDYNELCMLPEDVTTLPFLKILDLYENCLYEIPNELGNIEELDVAQNYLEEPTDEEYLVKKVRLRRNICDRCDGRKAEIVKENSVHSPDTSDDEELIEYMNNQLNTEPAPPGPSETPEDWDSEDYWTPSSYRPNNRPSIAIWQDFVKKKVAEGNFCPEDLHTTPIAEVVKQHRLLHPKTWITVEGQFDDYSGDES